MFSLLCQINYDDGRRLQELFLNKHQGFCEFTQFYETVEVGYRSIVSGGRHMESETGSLMPVCARNYMGLGLDSASRVRKTKLNHRNPFACVH